MLICPGSAPAVTLLRSWRARPAAAVLVLAAAGWGLPVWAADANGVPTPRAARPDTRRVQLSDGIYRDLAAELQSSLGQTGKAFDSMLAAAQRSQDTSQFRRALELALQASSQDRARRALSAWRTAQPTSIEAMQREVQISLLTGHLDRTEAPMRDWLAATQGGDRVELIQVLPRLLSVVRDRAQAQQLLARVLKPYRVPLPATPDPARDEATQEHVAAELAVIQLVSDPAADLLPAVQALHKAWPSNRQPAVAAMGLMRENAQAESLVREVLAQPGQDALIPSLAAVRQAYAGVLARQKRYPAALEQLKLAAQDMKPAQAGSRAVWLALAATALSARQWDEAERGVRHYLDEQAGWKDGLSEDETASALLVLAEIQQGQGRLPEALKTLDRINAPKLFVATGLRRAAILLQQGQWPQAKAVIASLKDDAGPAAQGDAAAVDPTLVRQLQVLTDQKRWDLALTVLDAALAQGRSAELLYQKAMVLDRLNRTKEMDAVLQEALKLDPRHAASQNALGYGWADRGVHLDEARRLISAALQAQPDDPYVMDSMGWVAFRQGRLDEALKQLRAAWLLSHDAEIAAHLGEVLWQAGQRDEARAVWREGQSLAPDNTLIKDTLRRLGVTL